MDRDSLATAATRYPNLQGLKSVPIGVMFMLAGTGNLVWERSHWIFPAGLLLCVPAYLRIGRYYSSSFGRVTFSRNRMIKDLALTLALVAVMAGTYAVDQIWDLPISGFAAGFAAATLVFTACSVGLNSQHIAVLGTLLVVALLPVWGVLSPDQEFNVALLLMGIATIVVGVFDHRLLVRTYGPASGVGLGNESA
ncbi:MAG: hypothetical protein ACT4OM_11430 [Actinomycetota bacterium]